MLRVPSSLIANTPRVLSALWQRRVRAGCPAARASPWLPRRGCGSPSPGQRPGNTVANRNSSGQRPNRSSEEPLARWAEMVPCRPSSQGVALGWVNCRTFGPKTKGRGLFSGPSCWGASYPDELPACKGRHVGLRHFRRPTMPPQIGLEIGPRDRLGFRVRQSPAALVFHNSANSLTGRGSPRPRRRSWKNEKLLPNSRRPNGGDQRPRCATPPLAGT